jgi:hypothetical protein
MMNRQSVHELSQIALRMLWLAALANCTPNQEPRALDPGLSNSSTSTLGQPAAVGGTAGAHGGTAAPVASGAPLAGKASSETLGVGNMAAGSPAASSAAGRAANGMAAVAGSGAAQVEAAVLPCNVSKALAKNCQQCHGATPIGGAPMSLLSYADLHKPAATQPALKVYELAKQRIASQAKPMPPGGAMASDDFGTLDAWFAAGALAGPAADKNCALAPPTGERIGDLTYGALTPQPGETCYDFPAHQSTSAVDATPFSVAAGEHYEQFYFRAPWPKGSVATRYGTKLDNAKVLHHWLLFSTSELDAEGSHKTSPLPTLIGVNATLRAGWAVGGANLAMPADVGLEVPESGSTINVQLHYYNSTGTMQTDHTAVQVCTVPAGARPHTATMTWLGTEDLGGNKWFGGQGMPAHTMSNFSGTCKPLREGMNSTDPIHILAFWPHMHTLGVNMKTVVNHAGGMSETIFDKPFDFNHQVHYPQLYDLKAGDTLTATCTFNNTTDHGVPFGESTDTEMCFQFAYSWPAHALENHVASLLGASNTCW